MHMLLKCKTVTFMLHPVGFSELLICYDVLGELVKLKFFSFPHICKICTHLNYDFPTGTNSCMCNSGI